MLRKRLKLYLPILRADEEVEKEVDVEVERQGNYAFFYLWSDKAREWVTTNVPKPRYRLLPDNHFGEMRLLMIEPIVAYMLQEEMTAAGLIFPEYGSDVS